MLITSNIILVYNVEFFLFVPSLPKTSSDGVPLPMEETISQRLFYVRRMKQKHLEKKKKNNFYRLDNLTQTVKNSLFCLNNNNNKTKK